MPKQEPNDDFYVGMLYEKLEEGVRYVIERSTSLTLDDKDDRESLIETMVPVLLSFILTDEPGNAP